MLKIEQFVEQQFGIKLTKAQLEMIAMIAANPEKRFVMRGGKSAGKTTAYKAAMAYLQDGLKQAEYETGTKIDFGELLLETVRNAAILPQDLMTAVSKYISYQSAPKIVMSGKFDPAELERKFKV